MFAASKTGQSAVAAAVDTYFKNTTLLLHGDGTNGAQNNTFVDSSSNNFTITRNGDTTQGTFTPFSPTGWSNYFNGSTDYLNIASNAAFAFGTSDFTIECWAFTTASGRQDWFDLNNGTSANRIQFIYDGTNLAFYNNGSLVAGGAYTLPLNSWTHYALVRSSGTAKVYANGVQVGSSGSSATNFSANPVRIAHDDVNHWATGYISNARIVNGTAVYTGNFTPSTVPLTNIANTSLLTCQSNRFVDNSSNAFSITIGGTPSVQAFSPFNPSAAYSTTTNGGSGYFDGSGDWLTAPNNAAFNNLSGTTFTIEFWMYPTAYASGAGFYEERDIFSTADTYPNGFRIGLITNSLIWYDYQGSTRCSYAVPLNAWTHVAFTYSANTLKLYVNGVLRATVNSVTWNNSNTTALIGALNSGSYNYYYQGYLSNLRLANSVVYSTDFTPPTAPVTAISGTSLLLNFTNAGIIDSTSKNDLQTVGDAQVSTSVKKYGTGSIKFDGTGDYLYCSSSPNLSFGSGDFTIEFWAYSSTTPGSNTYSVFDSRTTGTQTIPAILIRSDANSNVIGVLVSGSFVITGPSFTFNQWNHIALCRSGSSTKLFVNGVQGGSTYSDTNNYVNPSIFCLGAYSPSPANTYFNGYIDDVRITKGVARYTTTFSPPTASLPDQ